MDGQAAKTWVKKQNESKDDRYATPGKARENNRGRTSEKESGDGFNSQYTFRSEKIEEKIIRKSDRFSKGRMGVVTGAKIRGIKYLSG